MKTFTPHSCPNCSATPTEPAPLFRKFARNTRGRDLIVGDIHGHFLKLKDALINIGFSPDDGDRLFCVGDLVDRGPQSAWSLKWISQPWFHAVAGNHEIMAIDYVSGIGTDGYYIVNGGEWNIQNTPAQRELFARVFASLPVAIEIETAAGPVGIVHADCPYSDWGLFTGTLGSLAPDDASEIEHLIKTATWSRRRIDFEDDTPVAGVRAVVVGHSTVDAPKVLGNTIYIDTGGWRGHDFCIIDAATLAPVK